ncbi:MAG: AgmX/PglI C-terminal domain-containing protein [Deltaproteobacteria bacterium]|nr:AgmX/PglI C-terminal domain-containing protein [Deltaproteobacteria bacterium]
MRSRKGLIGGGIVAGAIMLWVVLGPGSQGGGRDTDGTSFSTSNDPNPQNDGPTPTAPTDPRIRARDPEVREIARALRERIENTRTERQAAEASAPPDEVRSLVETGGSAVNGSPDAPGRLDPAYIREAVRELQPLIAECYELAREEDDSLAGRLVLEFDIEGEAEVGGVIASSAIGDESTLRHPTLDECVRETIYTLELPAPEGGGMVHVRYPFTFSQEDSEGDGT